LALRSGNRLDLTAYQLQFSSNNWSSSLLACLVLFLML
jgi:hypothetical protein